MKKLISMKQINRLCLIMLLMVIGGVEVEAQTLVKSWDFTSGTIDQILTDGTTYYPSNNDAGWYDGLAFKGNTSIAGNKYLIIDSHDANSENYSGVRIPAESGQIVKVTGYTESTSDTFTWIGAEVIEGMFGNGYENISVMVGVSIKGEKSSEEAIDNSISIENNRDNKSGNRRLFITKIEVYDANKDFHFIRPSDDVGSNYTIYDKGYVLKGGDNPLDVKLNDPNSNGGVVSVETELTKGIFHKWNGCDALATVVAGSQPDWFTTGNLGDELKGGETIYGHSSVEHLNYADITKADFLRIYGTNGIPITLKLNRQGGEAPVDANGTIGEYGKNGYVDVDLKPFLEKYGYVHLNAIKIGWGPSGTISSIKLVTTSRVKYTCECKGDIKASIDADGRVSGIDGQGGAIVVKASYTDPSSDIVNNAEYVITVPYETNEWDFNNTETKENLYLNTANIADWGLTWKVRRYNEKNTSTMDQLSAPVLSNTASVSGDNARFIDATAGLIFVADSYHFGTNTTVTPDDYDSSSEKRKAAVASYNSANNVSKDVMNQNVTMQVGSKLIIPNLTPGQHIRIQWNRHDWNKGELMRAYNVTDLEGTSMHEMLFYSGTGSNKGRMGHQQFIVAKEGNPALDGKVDVVFELVTNGTYYQGNATEPTDVTNQAGWLNIINIKVSPVIKEGESFYFDTHMRPGVVVSDNSRMPNNSFDDTNVKEKYIAEDGTEKIKDGFPKTAIYTYLRKKTEDITTVFETDPGARRSQAGRHELQYHILGDGKNTTENVNCFTGTLNSANCNVNADGATLHIAPEAHGSFTLVMEARHTTSPEPDTDKEIRDNGIFHCIKPFLLDSLHVNVKVYEYDYNEKPYPYTWAMEHFTGDTGNASLDEIKKDIALAQNGDSHFWDAGNVFNIGHPENMIALKVKTAGTGESKTVSCSVTGNTSVKDGNTDVATLTFGQADGNYTIVPNYNASITLTANVPAKKELFIREYGSNEQNDVLIYRSGVLSSSEAKDIKYTFDVRKGRNYKVYAYANVYTHEQSQLSVSNISCKYYPNGGDEYYIPEFDGLGFFPMEYWDKYDTNVQLEPTQNGIKLTSKDKTYCMIVPNVKGGKTVYLAVTDDEDNSSVAVGSPENTIKRAKDYSERVDMTSKITNADFTNNGETISGWTLSASNIQNATTKVNGINGKSTECWHATTYGTKDADGKYTNRYSFNLYQTITALPAGTYELRAKAFNAQIVEPTGKGYVEFYVKEGNENGNIIASTPVEVMPEVEDNGKTTDEKDYDVMSNAEVYSLTFTVNEDKNVTIGFQTVIGDNDVMAARWFMCDDFELWSYGTGDTKERQGYVYLDNTTDYNKRGDYHKITPLNIYEINGHNNDVPIYLKNVTIHKVAVSADSKNVNAAGYATEAREYPLDFTLANLFLGQEQKAYKVTDVDKTDEDNPKVTISEVRYIPRTEDKDSQRNNGVMITGDLKQETATNWPLFTTDVNRKMSDMDENKLIGVVAQANVAKNVEQQETDTNTNTDYYNYMLAVQGYNVQYDETDKTKYPDKPGTVVGKIEGLGFYLVMRTGTDMGNGVKYEGGKPKDHSAYLHMTEWLARKNEINKPDANNIHKVFFIDVNSILTDIDEIPVYDDGDDELPTTENIATLLQNGVFYTLQGMPVKNPTKGIYIFNGKKVYVK